MLAQKNETAVTIPPWGTFEEWKHELSLDRHIFVSFAFRFLFLLLPCVFQIEIVPQFATTKIDFILRIMIRFEN